MPVSEATYARVAIEDDATWELVRGRLRARSTGTVVHNQVVRTLASRLIKQTPGDDSLQVGLKPRRLRIEPGTVYLPDVEIIPREYTGRLLEVPGSFEVYDEPMPLVMEVSGPPPDDDATDKIDGYQLRGDQEIWHIDAIERSLTAWRRRPDGGYEMATYTGGIVPVASLPGVAIDLDSLFR